MSGPSPLSPEAKKQLAEILPPYGHPQNPLDVTGAAATRPEVWRAGFETLAAESAVGLVGAVTSLPSPGEPQREDTFHAVGAAIRATGAADLCR